MIDQRSVERAAEKFRIPQGSFERLVRRRDRKRRNQRIAAGVVGIAVFVAAVWIVTSGWSFNRSQTPAAPAPTVTEPVIGPTGDPYSVGFKGLPPEGATPSEPTRGKLVMSDGGIHPWWEVYVYADGRLIWARAGTPRHCTGGPFLATGVCSGSAWIEQRLTPEGVELLRSGAVELGGLVWETPGQQLPVSAWEDPSLRPYVPSRYMVCPWGPSGNIVNLLPAPAQELVRGIEPTDAPPADVGDWAPGCLSVTIEDARSLANILTDAGFESRAGATGTVFFGKGDKLIAFDPILPDGGFVDGVGG